GGEIVLRDSPAWITGFIPNRGCSCDAPAVSCRRARSLHRFGATIVGISIDKVSPPEFGDEITAVTSPPARENDPAASAIAARETMPAMQRTEAAPTPALAAWFSERDRDVSRIHGAARSVAWGVFLARLQRRPPKPTS